MSKLILNDVTNIDSIQVINDNFDKIEQELTEYVLYRDNVSGEANTVTQDIDMNGNSLLNVGRVYSSEGSWVSTAEVEALTQEAKDARDGAVASASQASVSAGLADDGADSSLSFAELAGITYQVFTTEYLGDKPTEPVSDGFGGALGTGAMYFNTTMVPKRMRVYNGATWQDVASTTTSTTTTIDPILYASKLEAETGTNNGKVMTPLRVKEAIDEFAALPANLVRTDTPSTITGVMTFATPPVGIPGTSGGLLAVQEWRTPGIYAYTSTPGTNKRIIEIVGGGGGSPDNFSANTYSIAGGGGGGAYCKVLSDFNWDNSEITVGAGGSGGAGGKSEVNKSGVTFYRANGGAFGGKASANVLNEMFFQSVLAATLEGAPPVGDTLLDFSYGRYSLTFSTSYVFPGENGQWPGRSKSAITPSDNIPGLGYISSPRPTLEPLLAGAGGHGQIGKRSSTTGAQAGNPGMVRIWEYS